MCFKNAQWIHVHPSIANCYYSHKEDLGINVNKSEMFQDVLTNDINEATDLAEELSDTKLALKSYKNERNLMLFPFCSTSKRKRINPIMYSSEDGKSWLEVTANNTYGMAKIWDFDILRFVFSKISAIAKETGIYPSKVSFTAYECLKALNRDPKAGKNVKWLREALDRLASTTYKGNIFREEAKRVTGFTLIKYEYEEKEDYITKIVVSLDERLIDSIRSSSNLLKINSRLIREVAGIKKRLLELVEVSMQGDTEWVVSLEHLQKLCANAWDPAKFKYELSTYKDLPWALTFEKERAKLFVIFTKK
jgi:plasmid replication initiation protein